MNDGISKALNTTFETKVIEKENEDIDKKISELKTKNNNLISGRLTIEDKEYLKIELMEAIESSQNIRRLLEDNISRPPIRSQDVEAYSMVLGQITVLLKELRQLNVDTVNTELSLRRMGDGRNSGNTTNNYLLLTSKDLDSMINKAKDNNQLKAIDATFDTTLK